MMSDLIETAKKLMALDDFRWRDGMIDRDPFSGLGDRVVGRFDDSLNTYTKGGEVRSYPCGELDPPDLNDHGTQGCVMAWCEEVFGASFHVAPKVNPTGSFVYQAQRLLPYTSAFIEVTRLGDERPTRIEAACAALLGVR